MSDLTQAIRDIVVANRILADQSRGTDDALVLVARYRGGSPENAA